jgi:hypothetical protein
MNDVDYTGMGEPAGEAWRRKSENLPGKQHLLPNIDREYAWEWLSRKDTQRRIGVLRPR